MEHILSTNRPWILLIFALVCINIIGVLFTLGGMDNPLAMVDTSQSIYIPSTAKAATTTTALDMSILLLLVLWVVVAYGVAKGHAWSWWLLTFQTIVAIIAGLLSFLTAQPVSIITFVLYIILFAALFKKETIAVFEPKLSILRDGLW